MISPAPTQRPFCRVARSAAHGAGVQFATDPFRASWDDEGYVGSAARMLTQSRYIARAGRRHSISMVRPGTPRPAMARMGQAWPSEDRQHVTPRNGDNFSRLDSTCLGWARQCSPGRGNSATRGGTAGQFLWAGLGLAKHGKAGLCLAKQSCTSPGTAIPDIFPSTKKRPHYAGQRSTG